MFRYRISCVGSYGPHINEMVGDALTITYRTFMKHVDRLGVQSLFPDYDWEGRGGLTLKQDYHVSYHRSKYRGKLCYYICHSSIEYIFTR